MSEIRRIPRWLYLEDVLPADITADDEAGIVAQFGHLKTASPSFRNDTGYPFKLESLTIGQMPVVRQTGGAQELPVHYFWWGGLGVCLEVEVGVTGRDINIVPGLIGACFADRCDSMCCGQADQIGAPLKFEIPYILAKDNGFHVTFYSLRDRIQLNGLEAHESFPTLARNGAMIAYGRDIVTNRPVILSGNTEYLPMTNAGHDRYTCGSADLMNRGQNDVAIEEIVFTMNLAGRVEPYGREETEEELQCLNYVRSGFFDAYMVNPILGHPWMPGSLPIPISMLAGRTFKGSAPRDIGPHVYTFPQGSYLQRREEINVRVRRSSVFLRNANCSRFEDGADFGYGQCNQPISVCLFGYLEVQ